jgi:hypothetical protein
MPRYTITTDYTACGELRRDGDIVCALSYTTDAERASILRGLNGPIEATAKRVAELRSIAADWRRIGPQNLRELPSTCELYARDLESQATYLEHT